MKFTSRHGCKDLGISKIECAKLYKMKVHVSFLTKTAERSVIVNVIVSVSRGNQVTLHIPLVKKLWFGKVGQKTLYKSEFENVEFNLIFILKIL